MFKILSENEIEKYKDDFIKLSHNDVIMELTAKELERNQGSDALNVGKKTDWIRSTVGIVGYAPTYSIISFRVKSVSRPDLVHRVYVQFLGLEDLKDEIGPKGENGGILEDPVKARDMILSIVKDDIKLHCTCESHQYYRSYQLTQLDAAIFPENRPPKINDPALTRTHMCHHEFATMKYILTYDQHLVKFFMMNDVAIANSLKIDVDTAAQIQLKDVIATWTGRVGDATHNDKLEKTLKQRIFNILKKGKDFINKFRHESVEAEEIMSEGLLREEMSQDTVLNTTNLFVSYVTDNFIPKESREDISEDLFTTIIDTFKEFYEFGIDVEEEDLEDEEEILDNEEEIGEPEMDDKNDLVKALNLEGRIKRLVEASFAMGPEEVPPDSPDMQNKRAMMSKKYDDVPADDLNGQDPSELKPEEASVQNAIKEYLRQTGKTAYADRYEKIILGLLRDFDSSEKLDQIDRFVGTVVNTSANLRVPEEPEIEEPPMDTPPMDDSGGGDEFGADQGGGEDPFSDEELNSAKEQSPSNDQFASKMDNKKQDLQRRA
jgi:hypothetical protein